MIIIPSNEKTVISIVMPNPMEIIIRDLVNLVMDKCSTE